MLIETQKDLIKEIALMDFECGQFTTADFFVEDEEGDFTGVEQDAADYYQELIDMGPAGFYEEFADELDFDPDFVAQYGDGDDYYESRKPRGKSLKENASDMDVYIVTPDWDQYPCDEHGNPDGWNPREEAEYFTKLENAALACGMQAGFIPFSDGDAESGMCAPETDGTWQATPAMLRQFIEEYDLPIKVYEQGVDGEVGEEIFDYQSLAFEADPIEQDEVRNMGE